MEELFHLAVKFIEAYRVEGTLFFRIFAALLAPVRRIKKYQVTALCLLGQTEGYVVFGYIITDRLKVVNQTTPVRMSANIHGSAASAKGVYNQGLGAGKVVEDVPDNLAWYPAGKREAECGLAILTVENFINL